MIALSLRVAALLALRMKYCEAVQTTTDYAGTVYADGVKIFPLVIYSETQTISWEPSFGYASLSSHSPPLPLPLPLSCSLKQVFWSAMLTCATHLLPLSLLPPLKTK